MPFITSIERLGRQEGRQEGQIQTLQQSILEALEIRFASVPEGLREVIQNITEIEKLRGLHRASIKSSDLESFAREV